MIDLRQTKEYAQYMQKLRWEVEEYQITDLPPRAGLATSNKCRIFIKKVPFLGKIIKIQRPQFISKEIVGKIINLHKPTVIYVEPSLLPKSPQLADFSPCRSCFLPPKTIHIDLKKSEKELLSLMKPKTRYNIKLAQKKGVEVEKSIDINAFANLWKSAARKRGMWLGQDKEIKTIWDAFGNKAHLLLAKTDNKILGGVLIVPSPDTAYYMYAGSHDEGKKLFAPTLLAWEAIKLAKKEGLEVFDFEGIFDERYPQTNKWKGFTKFKEGFGGEIITYPKTLVKYSNLLVKLFV